jgi:hypothetical protein
MNTRKPNRQDTPRGAVIGGTRANHDSMPRTRGRWDGAAAEDAPGECGPECDHPDGETAGHPFPGRPGYVTGNCGHAVAGSEWAAGFRNCERCGETDDDDE